MATKFIVLIGTSGSGKTSLQHEICRLYPLSNRVVGSTSREPRKGELQGVDYNFTTAEYIKQAPKFNHLVYGGNHYAFLKNAVNLDALFNVLVLAADCEDTTRLIQLLRSKAPTLVVGVLPPSVGELEKRMTLRGDNSTSITTRLSLAEREIEATKLEADICVVNSDWTASVSKLDKIINEFIGVDKLKARDLSRCLDRSLDSLLQAAATDSPLSDELTELLSISVGSMLNQSWSDLPSLMSQLKPLVRIPEARQAYFSLKFALKQINHYVPYMAR